MSLAETIPKCVFTRMECLEKKYPESFTIKEKLDMAYDFCQTHSDTKDFGNGEFFIHVEDLIGSENLQKLSEYKNVKGIWNIIRTVGSPTLYDKDNDVTYEGHLYLKELKKEDFIIDDVKPFVGSKIQTGETSVQKAASRMKSTEEAKKGGNVRKKNLPEIAVSSSNVMSRAVRDNKLYVRFHSSPGDSYKYFFKSNEEALKAADEITKESPGRYVWKNLRGKKLGPVFGKPKKLTPGGTSASIVPYDKSKYSRIKQYMGRVPELEEKVGSVEELSEKMRQFKVGVKGEDVPKEEIEPGELEAKGTSGAPFRPGELEKYQKRIYEEKETRRGIKDEVKAQLEKLRKKTQKKPFPKIEKKGVGRPKKKGRKTEGERELRMEERSGAGRHLPKEAKKYKKDFFSETDESDFDKEMNCDDCKEKKKMFYQKLCKECYQKRVDNYVDKYDFDESDLSEIDNPDNWVTIRGSHVFIKPGTSKTEAIKAFLESKGRKKLEILKKVEKEKKEKEPSKPEAKKEPKKEPDKKKAWDKPKTEEEAKEFEKKEEPKKKERETEIKKEAKRRTEIDRMARARKKDKPLDPREVKIQKTIEKTGISREEAEAKHPKEPSKKEESVKELKQKRDGIKEKIKKEPEKKSFLLKLLRKIDQAIAQKIREELNKKDFKLLMEIKELEAELETYDYYIDDHLEEFQDYIENDFDTSKPGHWITTKYGKRVYIQDIEFYTEAELNPYARADLRVSPILRIDKRLELGYGLDAINNTITSLPINLTNMVNEIRVYKKITQDPSMRSDKGKVPDAYKKVGWKRTYDQISGVYIIDDNNIILTPDAFWGTVRHEIGHAVWYGLKERDRIKFKELHKEQKPLMLKVARKLISESKKYDKDSWDYLLRKERAEGIKYEANDVEEYFAEGFNRYYEAKAPIYSWQERKNQKQPSSELAHFFRTRMKKYEKEKEVNPFEVITNIV